MWQACLRFLTNDLLGEKVTMGAQSSFLCMVVYETGFRFYEVTAIGGRPIGVSADLCFSFLSNEE